MSTTYTVPGCPADPQAAALELIQRLPGDVLGRSYPPRDVLQTLAALLIAGEAFAGLSWHDAKHAATAIVVDLMSRGNASSFLLGRADCALDGSDGMRWDDPAAMSRALTIGANVLGLLS